MAIEVELKSGWTDYEGNSWQDVILDGWVFNCIDMEGYAVMNRNGYLNRFRNKEL